jgi:hypothetical protein
LTSNISLRLLLAVAEAKSFNQMAEFFFFGCLMVVDMGFFILLAVW